jgi:NADPH:quinone reductase-like Zn-dependent oxidoreductase
MRILAMLAVVYHSYGTPDVLKLEEIDKPAPDDDQVLVKVRAVSVNPLDWHSMEGSPYLVRLIGWGLLAPKDGRLGVDYAGTVEAVGKNVTRLKPGDEVFGARHGAFAEYVVTRADGAVAVKPPNLSFEQAAAIPIAAVTALQAVRDSGKVQPGQQVLINGASGGVGTFAVQIAKSYGAEVTGVSSTRNLELVRSLGADHVVDYTKEDFTAGAQRYDVIIDIVGNRGLLECRRALKPGGKYILVGGGGRDDGRWVGPMTRVLRAIALSRVLGQQMEMMLTDMNQADLGVLADLMRAGKVTPVVDRKYPFADLPEAMRYLEEGHARGKVVVTLDPAAAASGAPRVATAFATTAPALVALALVGVPAAVALAPIFAALILNRRFRRRHPEKRPYRWGYYFSIMSLVGGLVLGLLFDSVAGLLACAAVYAVLAWCFARRRRWAWLALTIVTFNPIAWVINLVYLRKRWAEGT